MNRTLPGRTFFVTVYAILAIGFLTIHFTRVESFSTVVDGISVKGRSSIGTTLSAPQIRRLNVEAKGLELAFSNNNRAVLVTDDGIRHLLNITGWEKEENSIRILFNQEISIKILSNTHEDNISIIPEIPATIPPVRSLELPFQAGEETEISLLQDRPGTLGIKTPEKEYIASLPKDSTWDSDQMRLNLVVLDKADPFIKISDDRRGGGLDAEEWLNQGALPSYASFNSALEKWLSASRNNWELRLLNKTAVQWDDKLAAAVLSDSVTQGTLPAALSSVTSLADHFPRQIGWLPSPYLGNIVNQARVHRQQLESEARNLINSLGEAAPNYNLKQPLHALLDSGFPTKAELMTDFARKIPPAETANAEIIYQLAILQEAEKLSLDDPVNDPDRRKDLFDTFIIPRIFWVKDGLWLIEEDGSINLDLTIKTGNLLIEEARKNNDSRYQAIGRQLIMSVLNYSSEDGSIPAKLFFNADGAVSREGSIPPEEIYPLVINPPAYPRHVSLASELGSGSWALTAAERFTLRSTPRETTISMDFPPGSIHHLAIKGIKSFNVLYMNGIRWNGDPNFQRYYAGWYYDKANETLYMKIRHRKKTETIRILYYDPAGIAATTTKTGE